MESKILNGKELAKQILDKLTKQIANLPGRKPTLAVILVGNDPASKVYVKNKKAACAIVGIKSLEYLLPETTTQEELLTLIDKLNKQQTIDGILVQLPLPKHLNNKLVIDAITPYKDVDGFHRYNMGSLALNDPQICPCTPHGIIYLLDHLKLDYPGKNAVIIGSSTIVGRPMALELLNRGATVTVCNSKTKELAKITRKADILIVAVGKPKLVKSSWLKNASIVIDVGINRLANGTLCGDVDFAAGLKKASYITPVPGGVGPMTIAMLMQNTLLCYTLNR